MCGSAACLDLSSADMAYKSTMQQIFLKYVFNTGIPKISSVQSCEAPLQIKNEYFSFLLTHKQPIGFFNSSVDFSRRLAKEVLERKIKTSFMEKSTNFLNEENVFGHFFLIIYYFNDFKIKLILKYLLQNPDVLGWKGWSVF